MDITNQYSGENPERIRYWIRNNIHMVWDQVEKLKQPELKGFVLKITFYPDSFPIVAQWSMNNSEFKNYGTYTSENMWTIEPSFFSINEFADWVNNVKS